MALLTEKTLFIHVRKTGGTTVRHAMHLCQGPVMESGPIEREHHIGLPELRVAHPGIEARRLTFGFVRHPVTWLRSIWSHALRSGYPLQAQHRPDAARLWIGDCWSEDFTTFAELYLERHAGGYTRQAFHALGLWSSKPVDRVGRQESLIDDLIGILQEAGESFDEKAIRAMGKKNASPHDLRGDIPETLAVAIEHAEWPMVQRFYTLDVSCREQESQR